MNHEIDWALESRTLAVPQGMFIAGRFQEAASGSTLPVFDPSTGSASAELARGDAADVDRAVAAARSAFDAGVWSRAEPSFRKAVMMRLADLVEQHQVSLAALDARDGGKTIVEAYDYEVPGAAALVRWYAETIDKVYGEIAPNGESVSALISREPLGVVAAVTPWNFPLEMPVWKIAPALAAGNSVVLKPSEEASLPALRLAELATQAGLPDGVLNVVTGTGPEAGRALGLHQDVDTLAFTGSTQVGKLFLSYAGESNMKQVWLECGGKSANLVFADTADLALAADKASFGVFGWAGQVCSANTRLLVERSIHDEFIGLMQERLAAITVGAALDPETTMGPLISARQQQRVLGYIAQGEATATRLEAAIDVPQVGYFAAPTIFVDVAPDSVIAQEEIFGPVLAVTAFDTEEEAIQLANSTPYALAASVWSDSLARAHRVSRALHAGTVSVNTVDAIAATVPFGGFKQSGFGRDLSLHALEKYTGLKTTWYQF